MNRKGELVKQAMDSFCQDPRRINIDQIVPLLVKNGNFRALVEICLNKVQHLDLNKQSEEIEDIYNLISSLVEVFDMAVKREDLSKSVPFSDCKHFGLFQEYVEKDRDRQRVISLRRDII